MPKINLEEWDDYEVEPERPARPGGHRNPSGKTSQAIATEGAKNAHEKRTQEAHERVEKVVANLLRNHSPEEQDKLLSRYIDWVNESVKDNEIPFDPDKDVDYEDVKRSKGPGGQNVNKTSTAIRASHPISGLFELSSEEASQPQNKQKALTHLEERIMDHLRDWRTVLTEDGQIKQAKTLKKEDLDKDKEK